MALTPTPGGKKPTGKQPKSSSPAPAPRGGGLTAAPGEGRASSRASGEKRSKNIFAQAKDLVGGFIPSLARLGLQGGKEGIRLADIVLPGGSPQAKIQKAADFREQMPLMTELVSSPLRTARQVPDTIGAVRPGGPGFGQSSLGKEITQHGYLGTGLTKMADISMLAGGVGALGKAAGFGSLAKAAELEGLASTSSRAAGLGKVADVVKLEEAATAAAAAGKADKAADLAKAAAQVREAQRLRAASETYGKTAFGGTPTRAVEKTVAGAEKVKTFGAQVANAPAAPYVLVGKGVARVAERFGVAERLAPTIAKWRQSAAFRSGYHENVAAPKQAEMYRVLKGGGLEDVARTLSADEQVAWSVVKSGEGLETTARSLVDEFRAAGVPDDEIMKALFPHGDVTPAAYDLARAWHEGRLPQEQAARLDDARTRLDDMLSRQEERYTAGRGEKDDLSPEALEARRQRAAGQSADMDVAAVRDRLQAAPKRRLGTVEAEAQDIILRNLDERPPAPLTPAGERQVGRDQGRVAIRKSIERNERNAARKATAGRRLGRDQEVAGTRVERLQAEADRRLVRQDEKRLAVLQERRDSLHTKLEKAAKQAEDSLEAAPPQDRPALQFNRRAATLARDLATAHPEHAAEFHRLAGELSASTKELRAAGIEPEFIFGGKTVEERAAARRSPAVSTGGPALRARKGVDSTARTGDKLQRTVAGQVEKYAEKTQQVLVNEFAKTVQKQMGQHAGALLAAHPELRGLKGDELDSALKERGWQAWDPAGSGRAAKPETVSVNSAVVPKQFFDKFQTYTGAPKDAAVKILKVYDKATGTWKTTVLALSPRWHVGNVLGNTMMATLGAGLSPVELVRHMAQARRLLKSGEAMNDEGIVRLLSSGFHAEDLANLKPGRGRLSRVVRKSYNMNEYVDNLNRTAIYLAKKKSGVSSEAAVKMALRAAGDYGRMTPNERMIVKRLVPFWAWQKHITKLTFSLPLEHPARVAWTLHLADLGNRLAPDEGADNPFNVGTIPVGDRRLSLKGFDPFGSSFFADPSLRSAGYSLNPVLKAGVVGATGLSPNRGFQKINTPETQADFIGGPPGAFALRDPVRFGQYLARNFPQVGQLQDFAEGEAPVRFETGQPRKSKGGKGPVKTTGRGRLEQIARIAGVPFPEKEQKPTKPKR